MSVCVKKDGQLVKTAGLYRSEVPIGIADIYTEGERQVGVWTNGKPLYQRTLIIDTIASTLGVQRFAHNIENIETTFAVSGTWLQKSNNSVYIGTKDIIRTDGNLTNVGRGSVGVWVDDTNIVIDTTDDRSSQYLIVTIQYTKTTDASTGVLPKSASALYLLGDVEISEPQNGQAIIFDETDNKWKNGAGGGGVVSLDILYPHDSREHQIGTDIYIKRYAGSSPSSDTIIDNDWKFKQLLNVYGYCTSTNSSQLGQVYIFNSVINSQWQVFAYQDTVNGYLRLANGSNFSGGNYELWVTYRKSSDANIVLKYNNGTSGSTSYTITDDGLYLIIASQSYGGSASITLPSGRTELLNGDIRSGNRGMVWNLVELQTDDIVTMSATASSWTAFSKSIYKLNNMNFNSNSSVVNSAMISDNTAQLAPPSTDDKCLIFGVGMGRASGNYRNDTDTTGKVIDAQYTGTVGVNTVVALYYGTASDLPTVSLYGYDGGGAYISCIKE